MNQQSIQSDESAQLNSGKEVANKKTKSSELVPKNTRSTEMESELDFEAEAGELEEVAVEHVDEDNKDDDSEEDGQCTPEREEKADSLEEGEDDGEISDNDFEEGELVESSSNQKQPQKQVCKFFLKGNCTWGNQCRFLHLNGEKGCYSMFEQRPRLPRFLFPPMMPPPIMLPMMMRPPPPMMMMPPPNFMPMPPPMPPPPMLPPPPMEDLEESPPRTGEEDWETTLQETKALVRKASKKHSKHSRHTEYDKENHRHSKSYGRRHYGDNYNNNGMEFPVEDQFENPDYNKDKSTRVPGNSSKKERSNSPRRERHARSGSYTSFSSHSFSDRSTRSRTYSKSPRRSHSRTRSGSRHSYHSRSRSFSRSLSMDSVSSASNHSQHGVSRRKIHLSSSPITTSFGEELKKTLLKIKQEPVDNSYSPPPTPEKAPGVRPLPQLHHLIPDAEAEEANKPTKPPVKFTFLKKNKQIDKSNPIAAEDSQAEEKPQQGVKRSLSPDKSKSKKSSAKNSRRDELLKQLKAVEDAIARKRAKC